MITLLDELTAREFATPAVALAAVRVAFVGLAEDKVVQPASFDLAVPDGRGELHVKGAYIDGSKYIVYKSATGFYGNNARGLASSGGMSVLLDAVTGFTVGIVVDNGYLTQMRTAAAGALAAQHLSNADAQVVGLVGAGGQARFQLEALMAVRQPTSVLVWSPTTQRARQCAQFARERFALDAQVVADVRDAVEPAHIVITSTPSRVALVEAQWVQPGTHITAMGSDFPGKQELSVELVQRATRIVADLRRVCIQHGECQHGVAAGVLDLDCIEELGDIVSGRRPGRQHRSDITVADQCGLGVQDAAIAEVVFDAAIAAGRGMAFH
jgi:ornithine cyclodeaminase